MYVTSPTSMVTQDVQVRWSVELVDHKMRNLVVPSQEKSNGIILRSSNSDEKLDNETSNPVKNIEELLRESIETGDLVTKRNRSDIKYPNTLRQIEETVAPWSKDESLEGFGETEYETNIPLISRVMSPTIAKKKKKAIKARKMKVQMAKNDQRDQKENKEVFGRERLGLKLPQILQRQQEVMEFHAAAKRRITKHDEALLEIDSMLEKLDRKEQKRNKNTKSSKPKLQREENIDNWKEEKNNATEKPITYHDSLTDSLDKLLDDIEEYIDDNANLSDSL